MINLANRIEALQDALNEELNRKTQSGEWIYSVNDNPVNTRYSFALFLDAGKYGEAIKRRNIRNTSIFGLARAFPQSIEGSNKQTYNTSIGCNLDLLIPIPNVADDKKKDFLEGIRAIIDTAFAYSSTDSVVDDGIVYYIATRPEIAQTGERRVRETVGDSIVYSVAISFSIIANGVSSDATTITIDGETVEYSKWGAQRDTITESGVPSDTTDGASKAVAVGSVYGLHIDLAARAGDLYAKYVDYIENGVNDPMTVVIDQPIKYTVSNDTITVNKETSTHTMIFGQSGNSGEIGKGVAISISLVEVM